MKGLSEVWVTGVGIVSALGIGFDENIENLRSAISPLSKLHNFDSIYNGILTVGQVSLSNEELKDRLIIPREKIYSRTTLLALMAAYEALNTNNSFNLSHKISLACASTVGGMDITESRYSEIVNNLFTPDKAFINEMDSGSIGRTLISELLIGDENFTISTACSSSSNSIMLGCRLIQYGGKKMVLAGGSDSLSKFVINGFLSLKNVDPENCKPFDQNRNGLNLGEGSAFLLLEDRQHAEDRSARPLAKLSGYYNINETYHMTGSSPEGHGAAMAMLGALEKSRLKSSDIDFVHAHGTSTIDNDLAESMAIKKVFGQDQLFASSKPFTGHSLAASGSISSVLSIGCMENNFLFPNLNFESPIQGVEMIPTNKIISNFKQNHCMINSFGFGGNNTSLIISKMQ